MCSSKSSSWCKSQNTVLINDFTFVCIYNVMCISFAHSPKCTYVFKAAMFIQLYIRVPVEECSAQSLYWWLMILYVGKPLVLFGFLFFNTEFHCAVHHLKWVKRKIQASSQILSTVKRSACEQKIYSLRYAHGPIWYR